MVENPVVRKCTSTALGFNRRPETNRLSQDKLEVSHCTEKSCHQGFLSSCRLHY